MKLHEEGEGGEKEEEEEKKRRRTRRRKEEEDEEDGEEEEQEKEGKEEGSGCSDLAADPKTDDFSIFKNSNGNGKETMN